LNELAKYLHRSPQERRSHVVSVRWSFAKAARWRSICRGCFCWQLDRDRAVQI